jgi:hypothetical protein
VRAAPCAASPVTRHVACCDPRPGAGRRPGAAPRPRHPADGTTAVPAVVG